MRELNFKVDHQKHTPRKVAREFLLSRQLLHGH
jgi:glycine betaine/choline ABC-type transport system substrate-binding protein